MKTLSVNGIDVPVYSGTLGISLSGGADSAVLLYMLMANTTDPIATYTIASRSKNKTTAYYAPKVIERCQELTGHHNVTNTVIEVDVQHIDDMVSAFIMELDAGRIDKIYLGTTQHPSLEVQAEFTDSLDPETLLMRNAGIKRPIEEGDFVIPFRNHNKRDIAGIYTALGLTDSLFPITRSCEDPRYTQGHCGKCWWCQERLWGFGRIE
jgi:7-cyano-7-deazaguanine synthase in queuosine biosynthesis